MEMVEKLAVYLRAAYLRRSINLRGFPIIPKRWWFNAPCNRRSFNEFVVWIRRLQLTDVRWIVDVGANHGDFAQAASAMHPSAHVLLVEPLPTLQAELKRRAAGRNGRWHLASVALGRAPGQATLHVDPNQDAIGSLMNFNEEYLRANPAAKSAQSIPCEVTTLDRLCAGHGIKSIDLLKMDVEGFEFEALAGAGEMLPKTRSVVVEVSRTRHAGEKDDPLWRMVRLLESAGFALVELLPSIHSKERPWEPIEFNLVMRRARPAEKVPA
jgi:FkbM family methyltransferase